jgi:hypothetical protein
VLGRDVGGEEEHARTCHPGAKIMDCSGCATGHTWTGLGMRAVAICSRGEQATRRMKLLFVWVSEKASVQDSQDVCDAWLLECSRSLGGAPPEDD